MKDDSTLSFDEMYPGWIERGHEGDCDVIAEVAVGGGVCIGRCGGHGLPREQQSYGSTVERRTTLLETAMSAATVQNDDHVTVDGKDLAQDGDGIADGEERYDYDLWIMLN